MHRAAVEQFKEVLAQLDVLLVDHEREFATSLNPPATDAEIETLRAAVEPLELIEEVELLYRWHNGQSLDDRCGWPLLDSGPLLNTAAAVKHRDALARTTVESEIPDYWSASWLPLTHSSWNQSAVELGPHLQGIVIDASFPDGPSVQAESLAAVVQAICRLIEAGVPLDSPASSGPEYLAWMKRRNDALAIRRAPVFMWAFPVERGEDAVD